MPKGVLWRQADIFVAALSGRDKNNAEFKSFDAIVERARRGKARSMPAPPLMHGASHWAAFLSFYKGHTVVIQSQTQRLDPDDILSTIEREKVTAVLIVGDAFARPLLDRIRDKKYELSTLMTLVSGGAVLSTMLKQEFLRLVPHLTIIDTIGSSETGAQGQHVSSRRTEVSSGRFQPSPGCTVLSEDMTRVLEPGDQETGWFAQAGRVPLGYLGDAEKTRRTFPVIDGVRYSVPGDRARLCHDGAIEVYGRDSVTINSGGEKIFAEEVEDALKRHPSVYDAIVVGRPSQRWGAEVIGLVQLRAGTQISRAELIQACRERLAQYKLPKDIMFLDEIVRSPTGKADYRWARKQVG
jgi:fatty-acyl-CoA synthase